MSSTVQRTLAPLTFALTVWTAAAAAMPLMGIATERDAQAVGMAWRTNEADILGGGPPASDSFVTGLFSPAAAMRQYLGTSAAFDVSGDTRQPGAVVVLNPGPGGTTLGDLLRTFVNAPPAAERGPGQALSGTPARPRNGFDAPILGEEAREWMDEALRGIVATAFDPRADAQGRVSFSLLGVGDLGIAVSADRNDLALVSGDDVLIRAQRLPATPTTGGAVPEPFGYNGAERGSSPAGSGLEQGSPIAQFLQLAADIATHPISLLVYAIVIGYAVLWKVLSSPRLRRGAAASLPAVRRVRHGGRRHRFMRRRGRRSQRP